MRHPLRRLLRHSQADVPEAVAYAEYELDAVMLTGSCREVMRGRPGVSHDFTPAVHSWVTWAGGLARAARAAAGYGL
jgi:hypothetical protein